MSAVSLCRTMTFESSETSAFLVCGCIFRKYRSRLHIKVIRSRLWSKDKTTCLRVLFGLQVLNILTYKLFDRLVHLHDNNLGQVEYQCHGVKTVKTQNANGPFEIIITRVYSLRQCVTMSLAFRKQIRCRRKNYP